MKFTEHRDSNVLAIKKYKLNDVQINDKTLNSSFFLNQTELFPNWKIADITELETGLLTPLLDLKPEVILLGTGEKQVFPKPALFAFCSQQGIGLEVMDNAAACRTYNVLTTEDRNVVLAVIMP